MANENVSNYNAAEDINGNLSRINLNLVKISYAFDKYCNKSLHLTEKINEMEDDIKALKAEVFTLKKQLEEITILYKSLNL